MARILVADDHAHILTALRHGLEPRGHEVITASTGAEALALIASERPQAIVLDLVLPDIDGIDVLRSLAADRQLGRIPLLVLTGRVDRAPEAEAFGKPVVEKPFSVRDLTQRLEAMVAIGMEAS